MPISSSWSAFAASLIFLFAVTGCVPEAQLPADCDAAEVRRQSTLAADRLDPSSIEVCRGQQVTLEVMAEQDGVVHLHGYDDQAPASELRAGDELRLEFTAVRSGQFPIELHQLDGSATEVGILTVHEP